MLPIPKFYVDPSVILCAICLSIRLNLYVSKIFHYEFARERKFIQHCINQIQPPNLCLKAEMKSTPLILQTAKESRKVEVSLSEIDTLLSLKIFGNTNYLTGN